MFSDYQHTIQSELKFNGIGLHTGNRVNVRLIPAAPNSGIIFKRTDLKINNKIEANYKNVISTELCTKIENKFGVSVSTIEHLMGSFCGEGVDNIIVEVDSSEVPIMDGSAKEFVEAIRSVGTKKQNFFRKFIKINQKVEIKEGSKHILIEPSNKKLEIDFEIIYDNKFINRQRKTIQVYSDDLKPIYDSRTFCLYEDIVKIQNMGLGKGGSLQNAVVVKEDKVLNEEGIRFKDEFVMHKILDCMGDTMLAGYRIFGSITCSRGGHQLTNELLRSLLSNSENWQFITSEDKNLGYNENDYRKPIAVSA